MINNNLYSNLRIKINKNWEKNKLDIKSLLMIVYKPLNSIWQSTKNISIKNMIYLIKTIQNTLKKQTKKKFNYFFSIIFICFLSSTLFQVLFRLKVDDNIFIIFFLMIKRELIFIIWLIFPGLYLFIVYNLKMTKFWLFYALFKGKKNIIYHSIISKNCRL